ncbi:FAD-binding protein [candidate division NPL-UPA2 bacterium]|nr:FAD-binding protein [candidate division NPL-UPA2 bacterium]
MRNSCNIIDIAVFKEMAKGKEVYLDYSRNPSGFDFTSLDEVLKDKYWREMRCDLGQRARVSSPLGRLREINPDSLKWLRKRDIDLERGERIEIAPSVQHFQGGVKIRERGQTAVRGFYAAGECAGGQHGANRPGGNALLDSQVFGRIAGESAAEEAKKLKFLPVKDGQIKTVCHKIDKGSKCKEGKEATASREKIQDLLSRYASVVRTEEGLKEGQEEIRELREEGISADDNGVAYALETMNMLLVAETILGASYLRDESRGPHLRFNRFEDSKPVSRNDDKWRRCIVIRKGRKGMEFEPKEPIPLRKS